MTEVEIFKTSVITWRTKGGKKNCFQCLVSSDFFISIFLLTLKVNVYIQMCIICGSVVQIMPMKHIVLVHFMTIICLMEALYCTVQIHSDTSLQGKFVLF